MERFPLLHGNWVDLVLVLVFFFYLFQGIRWGFILGSLELLSLGLSFFVSLRFYGVAAYLLIGNFSLTRGVSNALGFLLVGFLTEVLFSLFVRFIFPKIPKNLFSSFWNRVLGVIPSFFQALFLSAFLLTLFVSLPIRGSVKSDVLSSKFGGPLVFRTQGVEERLKTIFGGAINDTLTFLTVKPGGEERVNLQFTVPKEKLAIDASSEGVMLHLINYERQAQGLNVVEMDPLIQEVARKHSRDMFERGYFSHYSPENVSPFQRMQAAGVSFSVAGENLALAPNVELAHTGLMNSPGHRRNILFPEFKRVGIGVIEGGIYGKMFTQEFAD